MTDLLAWIEDRRRASEPVNDWLDSYRHTRTFLQTLQQQRFSGLVQVVSRTLESYQQSALTDLEGLLVQCMDKQDFFDGTFTSKMGAIREQIARFERYEQQTRKPINPDSPFGRAFGRLRWQVICPHPAEARLSERQSDLSTYRAGAAKMSLAWLGELKAAISSGDVRAAYMHASQLPEQEQNCNCELDEPDQAWRYFHFLHNEFNLAVWEILDMAGLMEWMRLELEFDLASQNTEFPNFGYHASWELGKQLRSFFTPQPSLDWVGRHAF